MGKKARIKKKLHKECYNLDHSFIKWLEPHLKTYLEDADKVIDLEYRRFIYKNVEYTQKELIIRMLEILKEWKDKDWIYEGYYEAINDLLDIWKLVFHVMWW